MSLDTLFKYKDINHRLVQLFTSVEQLERFINSVTFLDDGDQITYNLKVDYNFKLYTSKIYRDSVSNLLKITQPKPHSNYEYNIRTQGAESKESLDELLNLI